MISAAEPSRSMCVSLSPDCEIGPSVTSLIGFLLFLAMTICKIDKGCYNTSRWRTETQSWLNCSGGSGLNL